MRTIKFCSVVFGVTSNFPVINKIHWCVALRRPSPSINNRRCLVLPAMSVINLLGSSGTQLLMVAPLTTHDEARCWSKISIFFIPLLNSMLPLGESPSEYCYKVWYGKTWMVWLSGSEKILKIRLLVLTQYTNVTDRRIDGHRMAI